MRFQLHRNKVVASKFGHTIEFVKGQLVHVPKEAWEEVVAVGAVPESELPEDEVRKAENIEVDGRARVHAPSGPDPGHSSTSS